MNRKTGGAVTTSTTVAEDAAEPPGGSDTGAERAAHTDLLEGDFWRRVPSYRHLTEETFVRHDWQARHSVTGVDALAGVLGSLVPDAFYRDLEAGLQRAPMSLRMSPYILSLIDWTDPYRDPLRRQFLPLASEQEPDHPMVELDSLHESGDSPVPGLVHRYPDKALFLALDTCPVYCRFCTRSYAVGRDTRDVEKIRFGARPERWRLAFDYLRAHRDIEDIVVSGGDIYNLRADQLTFIGRTLLDIPHIRRIRLSTKGIAVMPMKILSDDAWRTALLDLVAHGRRLHKQVAVHTHISHPREMTGITRRAMNRLFENGVTVRNQCVLIRGVNDDAEVLRLLVRRLGFLNIQPYYVYQHDLVPGVEDLRTTLSKTLLLEKEVRGATAGFNTPVFVLDTPGGGGKRDVHSFERYDRLMGISVYRSPCVDREAVFLYFDPIHLLSEEGRMRWRELHETASLAEEVRSVAYTGLAVEAAFP